MKGKRKTKNRPPVAAAPPQPKQVRRRIEQPSAFSAADAPMLTMREVNEVGRVAKLATVDAGRVRRRLGLSQGAFAALFGVSVRTLQEWEQKRRTPVGAARVLLQVIDREPDAVRKAVGL